jgi:hypothetical protein
LAEEDRKRVAAAAAFGTAGSGRSSGRLLFLSNWEKEDLLDLSFSY